MASAQITGFTEAENGSSFSTWTTTTLTVSGWAVATDIPGPAAVVQIQIDGKVVGSVVPSIARPDVATYLGSTVYTNSGWTFSYNVGANISPGGHTLVAVASDGLGNSAPLAFTGTASSSLTILTPQPPQGYLDGMSATAPGLSSSTVTESQSIIISGWVGDPQDGAPVKQVQVLMDGTAIGNATLGSTRTDVAAVHPTYLKSGWTFTYSAAKLAGPHTFTAVAYDNEGLSTTLTVIVQNTVSVLAADLTVASVGITGVPASGSNITVADTTTNSGNGTAAGSYTIFYLSTNGITKGTTVGQRYITSLASGVSSSGATTVTLPLNLTGTYYILACANGTNTVVESNTANNCVVSAPFSAAGADLTVASVSITGAPASGGNVTVADTTTNSGSGAAGGSYTLFYLSTNGVNKGTTVGQRYISSLASGVSSSGATTVTLPLNLTGSYYVLACANGTNSVVESNTTNNCLVSAPFSVAGADLTVSAVSTNPAAALPGGTMAISDTTANALASASGSYTQYYLSKTTTLVKSGSGAATLLGQRYIPALAASASSTGSVNVTIASNTAAGTYYLFACANGTNSVVETNTANNCTATPVAVYTAANTVFVDQNNANAANTSCGTSVIPCLTITEGLAAAKAGQTVLVNPGTYIEQFNITQNITLASATKNTAVVQAPAVLTADSNGLTTLVEVGGSATNVSIVNMAVSGPGPSSCGSINYGVFVTNANATIVGNRALSIRDNPYSGCQNGVAIRFGSQGLGFVGHTGTIAYNTIGDYQKGGIVVDGAGTNVSVVGNLVTGQNQAGVNGQNGIQISRGALGLVNTNTVSNNLYASPATPLNVSADGILIYDIVGGVTVTNNTVTGNDEGIGIYSDTTAATNVAITNNAVNTNAVLGIHVDANSSGNTIFTNTAKSNIVFDLADEHPDLTSNDWGFSPPDPASDNNIYGTSWFSQGTF
jgi:hypothetical protein